MGRVARQEDPAPAVGVGEQQMRRPGIGDQDVGLDLGAQIIEQRPLRVDRRGIDRVREPGMQGPGVMVVLGEIRVPRGDW